MPIHIASRRRSAASLATAYPGARIIDVTSKGPQPWVRMSPFYPHGDIPVPLGGGAVAQSVEGIWQALKVFADHDVDTRKLEVVSMTGLKRTVRKYGPVLGHRAGLTGQELLPYEEARRRIFLPAYRWVLENNVADLVAELRTAAGEGDVVLLDYTVNGDVTDTTSALSHAALIRLYVTNKWPTA
ncbi:DUF6939 family protein [Catenulispora rubra]|uniref:DUF6939 family protein n=1 Tax=Catenulispora rubra TaxID=280293 RepID=UPI00189253D3|nr:hypothetical protein [Catenulispora rubra]